MYLSADEFLDLERARLALRAHGIGADRGRLVREAIALLMMDLGMGIDTSVIARRLQAAGEPAAAPGTPAASTRAGGGSFDGGLAGGAAAVGGSIGGILASGLVAGGGPAGVLPAGGGPVIGVLASGVPATGPPEGPQ